MPSRPKYGTKLGFMSFVVKADVDALKSQPALNAEIRDNKIVYRHYYHIGIAVSSTKGLVVPVLRSAERLRFAEIEQSIADFYKCPRFDQQARPLPTSKAVRSLFRTAASSVRCYRRPL